ncbi:MAG: MBL fold metallo-hydrolase [Clostridia bacterium]|nr:MBL fold metallo-hydrolase [Clostridia bacterium]
MYFCPLFSGSSGNALFCQYGYTRLLIDAGKPGRAIEEALRSIGVDPGTLSGILVTHEHSDHIQGVGVLARRHGLPVYATSGTWLGMEGKIGKIPPELRREFYAGRDFYLGDLGVVSFPIPHDAQEPVGFRLYGGNLSVSTATDLGCFTREVYDQIAGSSLILLESNHDPDMLRRNPHYSSALKARILGERGHLSNESCAKALRALVNAGTGTVLLGHLSGENNTPELAMRVNTDYLGLEDIQPGRDVTLNVAQRDTRGPVYIIRETHSAPGSRQQVTEPSSE